MDAPVCQPGAATMLDNALPKRTGIYCKICGCWLNGQRHVDQHNPGKKHRKNLARIKQNVKNWTNHALKLIALDVMRMHMQEHKNIEYAFLSKTLRKALDSKSVC